MSYTDYNFAERLMDLRVQEEHHQAQHRRFGREAQRLHPSWTFRQRCKLCYRLGSLLLLLGARLRKAGLQRALPLEEAGS